MRLRLSIGAALLALLGLGGFALVSSTSATASVPLAAVAATPSPTASSTAPAPARGYCIKVGTGDFKNLWLDPATGKCPVYSPKDAYWGPVSLGGGSGTPGPAGPQGPKGDPGDSATRFISKAVTVNAGATSANVVLVQPKGTILLAAGVSPHGTGTAADAVVHNPLGSHAIDLPAAASVVTADTDRAFTVSGGTAADQVVVWLAVATAPAA